MANIKPNKFESYHLSFDGTLLSRGFWIYVYRVTGDKGTVLYVGRTGDNATRYAASPFARMGHHLEVGKNAKANTLTRQLEKAGFKPVACHFELMAFGPIFPEQKTMPTHKPYRDATSHLEYALAQKLKDNHRVLGDHHIPQGGTPHQGTLDRLVREVEAWLETRPSWK